MLRCQAPRERDHRKVVPVEVERYHETARQFGALAELFIQSRVAQVGPRAHAIAGKAGCGVMGLVPGSIWALRGGEMVEAARARELTLSCNTCSPPGRDPGPAYSETGIWASA